MLKDTQLHSDGTGLRIVPVFKAGRLRLAVVGIIITQLALLPHPQNFSSIILQASKIRIQSQL